MQDSSGNEPSNSEEKQEDSSEKSIENEEKSDNESEESVVQKKKTLKEKRASSKYCGKKKTLENKRNKLHFGKTSYHARLAESLNQYRSLH